MLTDLGAERSMSSKGLLGTGGSTEGTLGKLPWLTIAPFMSGQSLSGSWPVSLPPFSRSTCDGQVACEQPQLANARC